MPFNKIAITALLLFVTMSLAAQQPAAKIKQALTEQTESWNKGDIREFMQYYWNSDSLMFTGKSGITYGWKNTFNNYLKNYPDTATMGKLDFKILQMKKLSGKYFSVTGRWHLARKMGDVQGHFTLLWRRFGKKWLIVSDHTS